MFGSRHTMIAADIEQHTSDSDPTAAVDYVSGWTQTLHDDGLQSMVYGSFKLGADLAKRANPKPDAVWIARFRAHQPEPQRDPHKIPGIPAQAFPKAGQRAWQYAAEFKDDPNDVKATPCSIEGMNVDISVIDAEVFGRPLKVASRTTGGAVPPAVATPAVAPQHHTHVIQPGDTLSGLEARLHLKAGSLFAANQKVLDAAARQRGKLDSNHGNLIFPGVTITIPT
jgi:LysM repeat protein